MRKKLSLATETLRTLVSRDLDLARGGANVGTSVCTQYPACEPKKTELLCIPDEASRPDGR